MVFKKSVKLHKVSLKLISNVNVFRMIVVITVYHAENHVETSNLCVG